MSEGNSKKLPYKENEYFEDAIARQLRIIREALAIGREIDDPDLAERVMGRLTAIIQSANQTRNELIDRRDKKTAEIKNGE